MAAPGSEADIAATRTLGDRLEQARRTRFFGRGDEIALFQRMLRQPADAPAVLFVHGPGGIGKSALLAHFARVAENAGRCVVALDANHVEPTPAGFEAAWASLLGTAPGDGAFPEALVLLIDTFERLLPLERWLRENFLPRLPADAVVVFAGRQRADAAWRLDTGWAELATQRALGALTEADACALLAARGVPSVLQARAVALASGHPLALSLLADALRSGRIEILDAPAREEMLRTLVERFAQDIPSTAHRKALQALVLARTTTESLLAHLLGAEAAESLYDWLRRLPFVQEDAHGLMPHELAREAFDAEWAARDPTPLEALRQGILDHLTARIARLGDDEQFGFAREWLFMFRKHPSIGRYFDLAQLDTHHLDGWHARDRPALRTLLREQLGEASMHIAENWLARQPDALQVTRDRSGVACGFALLLDLARLDGTEAGFDPALEALAPMLARRPLQPGDEGWCLRLMLHEDHPQPPHPTFMLVSQRMIRLWITHRRLAWTLIAMPNPESLQALFTGMTRYHWHRPMPEADFEVGGRRFGVFARDWKAEPHPAWPSAETSAAMPLARDAFAAAVREALRHFKRPDLLAVNPLVDCAFLRDAEAPSCEALRFAICEAVQALAEHPRDEKFFHALRLTFLDPGPAQEKVAAELGLPFNTYRYHLARGIGRVVEALWQRELRASRR
jgi:hypothetical protein